MKKDYLALLGYILIVVGFVALILAMIGLQLSPIAFLDNSLGFVGGFVVKIVMLLLGFILFYMSRLPEEEE